MYILCSSSQCALHTGSTLGLYWGLLLCGLDIDIPGEMGKGQEGRHFWQYYTCITGVYLMRWFNPQCTSHAAMSLKHLAYL